MYYIQKISIKNYKSLKNNIIDFWQNKTVFVGKNDVGKTNILKAIRVAFWEKKIKNTDFHDTSEKIEIIIELNVNQKLYNIQVQAKMKWEELFSEIIIAKEIQKLYKKIDLIYITADRKYEKNDKNSWYYKLINLILENKENTNIEKHYFDKINCVFFK